MGGGLLSQAVLQEHSPEAEAPEVPARAFRVVCDNMLGGLGRTLRCLGVDVRVLHSGEDHRQAAEVSGPGGAGMFVAEAAPQLRAPHPEVGQGSPGCRAPPVAGLVCCCPGLRSTGSCGGVGWCAQE